CLRAGSVTSSRLLCVGLCPCRRPRGPRDLHSFPTRRSSDLLITYNNYLREQKRKYKKDRFNTANWDYNEEHDYYVCPNGQKLTFQYHSHRTDRYGFKRKLKVYQSESCDGCPLRTFCTKAKEGNNRK